MMKIGPQMFGRTVACPQCGGQIKVPFESDPKAEELYRFMKTRRAEERVTPQSSDSARESTDKASGRKDLPAKPRPSKAASPGAVPAGKTVPAGGSELREIERLDTEEIDHWIEEFWATIPEDEAGRGEMPVPTRPVMPDRPDRSTDPMDRHVSRSAFLVILSVALFLGFSAGLVAHYLFSGVRAETRDKERPVAQKILVSGKLFYRNVLGKRTPDADAVVLLLPQTRAPAFPVSTKGLRPNDEHFDPNGENVAKIEEFGGVFRRTGADGSFSASLPDQGRYLVLLISSHEKRDDAELELETEEELRRFFRQPAELIGDYCYYLEEYDIGPGMSMIRQTFSK